MSEKELAALFALRNEPASVLPPIEAIAPLPVEAPSPSSRPLGEDALRNGQVAVLVVAGGQGTRLGFDKPKGLFPVGPVSRASLFEIHAKKVLALRRKYDSNVPFLVMTSPLTHDDTVEFFSAHQHFGLPRDEVYFFQQGTMPALDLATGEVLLEAPGKPFLSPNGHGGTLTALADTGLLTMLKAKGVEHLFYFQVDNPLVKVAEPAFIGRHIETKSEASSKVVFKEKPEEKVGVLALVNNRCGILEYSDLPKQLAEARAANGTLLHRAGNPAIHIFSLSFLEKVTTGEARLQYHIARKKVPYYDPKSETMVTPMTENALKFELFIFDALPHADRWLAIEAKREEEFAPLKNATGADSVETVRELMIDRATRWLRAAGVHVPSGKAVEICPTFALDPEELSEKLAPQDTLPDPVIFHGPE